MVASGGGGEDGRDAFGRVRGESPRADAVCAGANGGGTTGECSRDRRGLGAGGVVGGGTCGGGVDRAEGIERGGGRPRARPPGAGFGALCRQDDTGTGR